MNQFERALAFYREVNPKILEGERNEWAIDPYAWDEFGIRMTPIEAWLWGDIRQANVVMYPQYPVGRYFVDFANPVARVAFECDGAAFHQDKEKDARRQAEIEDMGWTVYRFTGSECRTEFDEEERRNGWALFYVEQLGAHHRIKRTSPPAKQRNREQSTSLALLMDRSFA